jgi:IclR family pca regulon transcriptional regulator
MRPKPNEPDFVEALARGLKVISAFSLSHLALSVSDVAAATKLARPTTRRLLLTLESLGYVRAVNGLYMLTPKVL